MKVSELHTEFLVKLQHLMDDWKYIKRYRQFEKVKGNLVWIFHISCINHENDFDAVGNIAIEYKRGKERLCIIGAELGNIESVGQKRFPVNCQTQANTSAEEIYIYFKKIGMPFLQKYSNPCETLNTLRNGGKEAMLISPFIDKHKEQIDALSRFENGI
jgi:hypothetical protein